MEITSEEIASVFENERVHVTSGAPLNLILVDQKYFLKWVIEEKEVFLGPLAFFLASNSEPPLISPADEIPQGSSPMTPIPARQVKRRVQDHKAQMYEVSDPEHVVNNNVNSYRSGPRGNTITKTGKELVKWDAKMKGAFSGAIDSLGYYAKPKDLYPVMMSFLGEEYSYLRPRHLTSKIKKWRTQNPQRRATVPASPALISSNSINSDWLSQVFCPLDFLSPWTP